MAKRRPKVNKSQMIRDALAANPGKSPAEISALLKEQGLKVSSQFVSVIKSKAKRKPGVKPKRGRRKMVRVAQAASGGDKRRPHRANAHSPAIDASAA